MDDDSNAWGYTWASARRDLAWLVKRLRPEDALAAIQAMIGEADEGNALAVMYGFIRGSVAWRDDKEQKQRNAGPLR